MTLKKVNFDTFDTFDNLLVILGITEDDYILAIRSSINTPAIFLKRSPNELRINN